MADIEPLIPEEIADAHCPTGYKLGWGGTETEMMREEVVLSFQCQEHVTVIVLPRSAAGKLAEDLLKLLGN